MWIFHHVELTIFLRLALEKVLKVLCKSQPLKGIYTNPQIFSLYWELLIYLISSRKLDRWAGRVLGPALAAPAAILISTSSMSSTRGPHSPPPHPRLFCSLDLKADAISAHLQGAPAKALYSSPHLIMKLPRNALPTSLTSVPPGVFLLVWPFLPQDPQQTLWCIQSFLLILSPFFKQVHYSPLTTSILMISLSWPNLDTSTWT